MGLHRGLELMFLHLQLTSGFDQCQGFRLTVGINDQIEMVKFWFTPYLVGFFNERDETGVGHDIQGSFALDGNVSDGDILCRIFMPPFHVGSIALAVCMGNGAILSNRGQFALADAHPTGSL